jgi:hypothetical protein
MDELILAVDPGVSGGMALYREGEVSLRKFTTADEYIDYVRNLQKRGLSRAVVEDVPKYIGNQMMASHSFTLGYNVGFEIGVIKSLLIPVDLVRPQKWQGGIPGLKGKSGAPRKRLLKEHAKTLYPGLKVTLATADALLILDYHLRKALKNL